ncbi:hypothetical protein RP20_CCG017746 [Aedes albopictus]|nr:hypothetical protein RP20_CCG017746 [Aedes albopictus]
MIIGVVSKARSKSPTAVSSRPAQHYLESSFHRLIRRGFGGTTPVDSNPLGRRNYPHHGKEGDAGGDVCLQGSAVNGSQLLDADASEAGDYVPGPGENFSDCRKKRIPELVCPSSSGSPKGRREGFVMQRARIVLLGLGWNTAQVGAFQQTPTSHPIGMTRDTGCAAR